MKRGRERAFSGRGWFFILSYLIIAVSLMIAGTGIRAESDQFSESTPAEPTTQKNTRVVSREPDHLVPVDPNPAGYVELLRKQLKLDSSFFARMVVMPSFEGESSLRLHGKEGELDINKVTNFFLTCYTADKSIWESMPENNEEKKIRPIIVSVTTAPIPAATARRISEIWEKMLSRTHAPEMKNTGCDGVTIEFATTKARGETWTPTERKSPLLLEELGRSLVDYCGVKPDRRGELIKQIEAQMDILDTYLKEHPAK
jgi:hypothetical protein